MTATAVRNGQSKYEGTAQLTEIIVMTGPGVLPRVMYELVALLQWGFVVMATRRHLNVSFLGCCLTLYYVCGYVEAGSQTDLNGL